jgi:ribonuclease BN (tRNA processing enzyme)
MRSATVLGWHRRPETIRAARSVHRRLRRRRREIQQEDSLQGTVARALHDARDRSCAGYLLEANDLRLLIDCGSGITRRLAERGDDWRTITHVALTHFHIDHHGDLPTLVFAWKYGFLPPRSAPVTIIGPVGTAALLGRLAAAYGEWLADPGFPLTVQEITPADVIALPGGVRLTCHAVPHTPESVAYSLERGGRRIVYTGDTGPSDALASWAHGCDLLVCECSLPAAMAIPEHLTPEQCGELAGAAAPRQFGL